MNASVLRAPTCASLLSAMRGSAERVLVTNERAVHLARCTAVESDGLCAAAMTPTNGRPLPACDVGLHLRSLGLDSERCNLLLDRNRCPARFRRVVRACGARGFPRTVDGCQSPRAKALFATADTPNLYAHTRRRGWADLNETATQTWAVKGKAPGDVEQTVLAWATLARCRRAIVAPVPSAFSDTAALAAGVPLVGCCQQLPRARPRLRPK